MHSGQSNETVFNGAEEKEKERATQAMESMLADFDFSEELDLPLTQGWLEYVSAGQKNKGESLEFVQRIHNLGAITHSLPLSVLKERKVNAGVKEEDLVVEETEASGAGAQGCGDSGDSDLDDKEIPEIVSQNLLKIEMIKKDSFETTPRKKRKKKRGRRRSRKNKKNKVNLLTFLAQKTQEPEPVKVEEPKTSEAPRRRKRRRRKNKVVSLSKDAKMTKAELDERREIEEKISVKKDFQMETTSRKQYEGEKGIKAWDKGSGYGSSYTQDLSKWDISTWLSGEDSRQTQIREALSSITEALTDDPLFLEFVSQSCLLNVLYKYCENDSLNDIESKPKLYNEIFECLGKMMSIPAFLPLLHEKIGRLSITECVGVIADKFRKRLAFEKSEESDETENCLLTLVMSISDGLNTEKEECLEAKTETVSKDFSGEDYCQLMRELCFDSIESMDQFPGHKYKSTSVAMKRKLMKRLAAEYSDLGESLPIHEESSVFFRFCEESMSHAQMLIIPPEGTPYASGCFIFDVCFPATYPAGPPKVNLQTTGRGAVRFNPNLYNCGKVCLSLLGTWGGQSQGEQWNPKLSSFLQVAISIQSLIFVPEPYYNEPGWESYMGTADGDKRSRNYNKVIEKGTVAYAIVEMLENPPLAWKDVINNHFRLQADRVLSNVARWMGAEAEVTLKVEGLLRDLRSKALGIGA